MWETSYSREPVDYRLMWLRILKRIWLLPLSVVAGALLVTFLRYADKVWIQGRTYEIVNVYEVNYEGDTYERVDDNFYINYYTWMELADSDVFLNYMYDALGGTVSKEVIKDCTTARPISDAHYVYAYATSTDKELTKKLMKVFDEAMYVFVADEAHRMTDIKLVTTGELYESTDIRLFQSACLGALIGLFIYSVCILVSIFTDTSVYIPSTLERRFHIPTATAPSMKEFEINCRHILDGLHNVAVLPAETTEEKPVVKVPGVDNVMCCNPVAVPEAIDDIKKCDGAVVLVKAAAHNGRQLERTIEQLARHDVKINALVLVCEDTKLINRYYKH